MPTALQWFARVNPLTYQTDILCALMLPGGHSTSGLPLDFAVLTGSLAARLGLVNEVLADAKTLDDRVAEQAEKLLSKPAAAVRATRSLLRETASQTAQERLVPENVLFAELLRGPEAARRIAALMGR